MEERKIQQGNKFSEISAGFGTEADMNPWLEV